MFHQNLFLYFTCHFKCVAFFLVLALVGAAVTVMVMVTIITIIGSSTVNSQYDVQTLIRNSWEQKVVNGVEHRPTQFSLPLFFYRSLFNELQTKVNFGLPETKKKQS